MFNIFFNDMIKELLTLTFKKEMVGLRRTSLSTTPTTITTLHICGGDRPAESKMAKTNVRRIPLVFNPCDGDGRRLTHLKAAKFDVKIIESGPDLAMSLTNRYLQKNRCGIARGL